MPRWMAIGRVQGGWDKERFTEELKATKNWRADARTTITTVYQLGDGLLLAECNGADQSDFEVWLQQKGFTIEGPVQTVIRLAKTGNIWEFET